MIIKLILIFFAGIIASFINVNAGGGSLLTLPALIFMGLPSAVANGTNRIAILVGAISATRKFKNKGIFDWRFGLELAIPALIGAIIGANIAINIPDRLFNTILSCVMILVVTVIILDPQKRMKKAFEETTKAKKFIAGVAFFFVGFYGGFIQLGVGFLIMATLTLITGLSLVRINALKVFVVLIYTVFSLAIFVFNGKINLPVGIALSAGHAIGAHLGATFAVKKGDKWIRIILAIAVTVMALKLSNIF
ncbi:MAG: sulfite exporter TauE/SafE family protein [Candidatus Omnitrophica bacterium]|nr:sulfite exporter TauE/SafE family protein [Candidatus Omnitrophota bacterium]